MGGVTHLIKLLSHVVQNLTLNAHVRRQGHRRLALQVFEDHSRLLEKERAEDLLNLEVRLDLVQLLVVEGTLEAAETFEDVQKVASRIGCCATFDFTHCFCNFRLGIDLRCKVDRTQSRERAPRTRSASSPSTYHTVDFVTSMLVWSEA